jgi:fused signal recognition particle receptor
VLHPPAARHVEAAERQSDFALVGVGRTLDHGPVGLVDGAVLEQLAELRERLAVAAEHQAAGRIAVEPVRQRRRPRQAEAQRVEMVFEALAAIRAAMHGEPRRLVDHQHQPVAIQQPRHHLFRGHCCVHCRNRYHGRLMDDSTTKPTANWWQRLAGGLKKSSSALGSAIAHVVAKRQLDAATIDEIEDELIRADLGAETAGRIATELRYGRFDTAITPDEIKAAVATEVEKVLAGVAQPLTIDPAIKPFVILVAGVNGSGKTTTIGKLAAKLRAEGRTVMLAAGDTFRAAAIDQLKIWAERSGASFIAREAGADAAGLVFEAVETAKQKSVDVLLVDTAGRLQNRTELMGELEKVVRVMKKVEPSAPHAVLLVLDATVGQNALSQVEIFGKIVGVTGLVMTKLDGTARGGILVAIAEKFKMPVHFIGVGEGIDDLAPFSARDFARAMVGLDS